MLAKKKSAPEPSLLERIHQLRSDIDAFVEQKVMDLKNSRDGQSLFVGDIRHMLLRGDSCLCRAVVRLLGDPMPNWSPPMLGFDAAANLARVEWRDGTTVCGGILGRAFDPAMLAREAAEQALKEALRQQPNVVLLEDWRQKPHFSCNTTA